MLFAMILYLTE